VSHLGGVRVPELARREPATAPTALLFVGVALKRPTAPNGARLLHRGSRTATLLSHNRRPRTRGTPPPAHGAAGAARHRLLRHQQGPRLTGAELPARLANGSCSRARWWGDVMKVLVIASEPISADRLRAVLGGGSDDAEIMVVAPALHRSALRFWLSDADEAIRRAGLVQRETVEGLEHAGLDARGDTGEGDPVKAVEDVLVTFPAERIVIFSRSSSEQRHDEAIDADALQQRFGLPVQRAE
jgi:hypothetical protein